MGTLLLDVHAVRQWNTSLLCRLKKFKDLQQSRQFNLPVVETIDSNKEYLMRERAEHENHESRRAVTTWNSNAKSAHSGLSFPASLLEVERVVADGEDVVACGVAVEDG